MRFAIKVKDVKQFEVVIGMMLSSGKTFVQSRKDATAASYAKEVYTRYPKPLIDGTRHINATRNVESVEYQWPDEAIMITKLLFAKTYEVDNVGDYKATVTDKGIVVGCQTISFDKFQEIVAKVAEFKVDQ